MVVIFRGTSGSGKTRLAKLLSSTDFMWQGDPRYNTSKMSPTSTPATEYVRQLWNSFIDREHSIHYCSADDFFMVQGEYKYDKKLQGTAQQACLRQFYDVVNKKLGGLPEPIIIVDNTNTTIAEVAPYAALANAFAHELQVITLLTDPTTSWKRNQHKVPFNTVVQQAYRLNESIGNWPSWYPQQVFPE